LADDSADDIFFLSRALEKSGLNARLDTVQDGVEAIKVLRKSRPDLLLLDLKMPKVNGFEVLEWISEKSFLKDLPVVVLSSSDLEEDKQRAKDLGAKGYFVKTVDLEAMLKMIAELKGRFLNA
jgi:CheY-like chemotaxis protein